MCLCFFFCLSSHSCLALGKLDAFFGVVFHRSNFYGWLLHSQGHTISALYILFPYVWFLSRAVSCSNFIHFLCMLNYTPCPTRHSYLSIPRIKTSATCIVSTLLGLPVCRSSSRARSHVTMLYVHHLIIMPRSAGNVSQSLHPYRLFRICRTSVRRPLVRNLAASGTRINRIIFFTLLHEFFFLASLPLYEIF